MSRSDLTFESIRKLISEEMKTAFGTETMQIDGCTCYIAKNQFGAWCAYIDATEWPELHEVEYEVIDRALPFHKGCTYCRWTKQLGSLDFKEERFILGCDWCHGTPQMYSRPMTPTELLGVEVVTKEAVIQNLKDVIAQLPALRLKLMIAGPNANN